MTNIPTDKPIRYHLAIDESIDYWAFECGCDSRALKRATETAIQNRHDQATIKDESHRARGNQPDIFTLSLGSACVFYTVEPKQVLVRGYGWEVDHPLDDFDGGGFYCEPSWRN